MPIRIILGNDLKRIDRQIKALEYVIPKDTGKDRSIHKSTLRILKEHRKVLINMNGGLN